MLPNYEHRLEVAIDRELKALPDLLAPPTLIIRVMRAIAQNQALPWFRRAWQTWPMTWRVASFALLVVLFCGLSFGVWQLSNLGVSAATQKYGSSFSLLGTLWETLVVLFSAGVAAVKQMNQAYVIGCVAAIAFGYAMCVAFGTFCFALARSARRFTNET